jgi:SAM-dependent methyltransferase
MSVKFKRLLHNSYLHPRYIAQKAIHAIIAKEASYLSGHILDVGCGRKPYASLFEKLETYTGIDIPVTMHGLEQVDVVSTAINLPFQTNSFDAILCTEVLEHLSEPEVAVQEMGRVIQPSGYLLITVPFSEQLHEEPYDYYRFTRYGITHLLEKNGFKVVRIHERGGTWLELGYRLSSFVYSTLGATRSAEGFLTPKPFIAPIVVAICAGIQLFSAGLDRLYRVPLSTIGYGILAKKEV